MTNNITTGNLKRITHEQLAQDAPARWAEQYKEWPDNRQFADGTSKKQIAKKLTALKLEERTPENIEHILNKSWVSFMCRCCGDSKGHGVRFSDYGEQIYICDECIKEMGAII